MTLLWHLIVCHVYVKTRIDHKLIKVKNIKVVSKTDLFILFLYILMY